MGIIGVKAYGVPSSPKKVRMPLIIQRVGVGGSPAASVAVSPHFYDYLRPSYLPVWIGRLIALGIPEKKNTQYTFASHLLSIVNCYFLHTGRR